MRSWERRFALAALDERRDFGFVRWSETVDKLRQRPPVVAHGERAAGQRFGAAAAPVSLHHYLEGLLLEAADVNLSLFTENHRFHAVAGDVVAAHLNLRGHLAIEP